MRFQNRYFILYLTALFVIAPFCVRAAEVGFVPSSGIWFSKQEVKSGETVKIYAVIVNNAYASVRAKVVFYDNVNAIGNVAVDSLGKEQAQELWIIWAPSAGTHQITARFISAIVTDADGKEIALDPSALNTIGESSLSVSGGAGGAIPINAGAQNNTSEHETAPTSTLADTIDSASNNSIIVRVTQDGDKLLLESAPYKTGQNTQPTTSGIRQITITSKDSDIPKQDTGASSTVVSRTSAVVQTVANSIQKIGDTMRLARESTVRTIRVARGIVESGRVKAEGIGAGARAMSRNKIALAWGGFLSFIALAGLLSYAGWRKYK